MPLLVPVSIKLCSRHISQRFIWMSIALHSLHLTQKQQQQAGNSSSMKPLTASQGKSQVRDNIKWQGCSCCFSWCGSCKYQKNEPFLIKELVKVIFVINASRCFVGFGEGSSPSLPVDTTLIAFQKSLSYCRIASENTEMFGCNSLNND